MSPIFLTAFTLVWPIVVAGVLSVISRAFFREMRQARLNDRPMI